MERHYTDAVEAVNLTLQALACHPCSHAPLRNVPGNSLYFASLSQIKALLTRLYHAQSSVSETPTSVQNAINLAAGGSARSAVGIVLMPLTVIKVRYEVGIACGAPSRSSSIILMPHRAVIIITQRFGRPSR